MSISQLSQFQAAAAESGLNITDFDSDFDSDNLNLTDIGVALESSTGSSSTGASGGVRLAQFGNV